MHGCEPMRVGSEVELRFRHLSGEVFSPFFALSTRAVWCGHTSPKSPSADLPSTLAASKSPGCNSSQPTPTRHVLCPGPGAETAAAPASVSSRRWRTPPPAPVADRSLATRVVASSAGRLPLSHPLRSESPSVAFSPGDNTAPGADTPGSGALSPDIVSRSRPPTSGFSGKPGTSRSDR
jgi:hypothetical protein